MISSQLSLFDGGPAPAFSYGPTLSPQQAHVRDGGAGDQVVVAGAGTGKTETLTQRILKLLVEGDGTGGPVELERVLALTFTDKGAAEMRGRVYARLAQIGRELPRGALKTRLENLRAGFAENNRILTFDAFSFRLLSQFPQHCPLPGDLQILDDGARSQACRAVTRQFWNRLESASSPAEQSELWELLSLFSGRRAALQIIGELAETEREADLRALSLLPDERDWRATFDAQIAAERDALWRAVEREIGGADALAPLPPELRRELLDPERVLTGGRKALITQKGEWSSDFTKRWSPELWPALGRVRRRLLAWKEECATPRDAALDWRSRRLVARACGHALWWQGAMREWCAQNGAASFAEIAAAAGQMLAHPAVAARLRDSFSHLLVDEFQDTNWGQWAIIDALRDRERGNVLIVGDEKQAIFRFRGGDITVFDGVRRQLLGEQKAAELTVSRRSTRQLVAWTNAVFERVLPSSQERQPFEAPFQALQAETEAPQHGLWSLPPHAWHSPAENAAQDGSRDADLKRERAARALARFLRQLCDDAALLRLSQNDATSRFPDLREITRLIARGEDAIGVLFTSHLEKTAFENWLRAYDVPFVAVKGRGFWSSDAAIWTLHLLQFWLDGSDRRAFVALSRSPLGALSDVALMEWHLALQQREAASELGETASELGETASELGETASELGETASQSGETASQSGGAASEVGRVLFAGELPCYEVDFTPSRPDDAQAWALWKARLRQWRDEARIEAASEVLERVLEESELAFYEAGSPDAAQREQNWRKMLDWMREREADGQGGLRALLDYFGALSREAGETDQEEQAPLPAQGSIQLMTVHAAKGLGFPMTILAQLDGAPQSKGLNLLRGRLDGARQMAFRLTNDEAEKAPAPHLWDKLRERERAEEEAQWRRLFYVACTRAQSQLVLLCPEGTLANGAAWANLCADGWRETRELVPQGDLPAETRGARASADAPLAPAPPLPRAPARETALSEIAGVRAERFDAQARAWMETRLAAHGGDAAHIREDVPFSAPARALHVSGEWIVGAWEWVAPLAGNELLLAATGPNRAVAAQRAKLMALAARDAGFELREIWALHPGGEAVPLHPFAEENQELSE